MSALIGLFLKLSAFSLIAFGGVNALLPVLFNLAVNQEHWIDVQTFSDYFAIAQAAPGPNFMTVTLIGWHMHGVLGALIATLAIAWPSSILIYFLQRFLTLFQCGMRGPLVINAHPIIAFVVLVGIAEQWQPVLQWQPGFTCQLGGNYLLVPV